MPFPFNSFYHFMVSVRSRRDWHSLAATIHISAKSYSDAVSLVESSHGGDHSPDLFDYKARQIQSHADLTREQWKAWSAAYSYRDNARLIAELKESGGIV